MPTFVEFLICYLATAVVWVIALVLYNTFIESLHFGPLGSFTIKSAFLLLAVVLVVMFVPLGGWLSLLVWGIGLLFLFHMDAWEMRMLIGMVWLTNIGLSALLFASFGAH